MRGMLDAVARHRVLAAWAMLALLPFIAPSAALASLIVVMGLYALGFNLLFGYAGLLSFGHSALIGAGGYACGIAIVHFGWPWWAAILTGPAAGGLVALAMGLLAVRTRGIYFAMVTLALSQCVYYVALKAEDWTGGENGLRGVNLTTISLGFAQFSGIDPMTRYTLVAVSAGIGLAFVSRVLRSPFGAALSALRENEARARACGYDINRIRLQAFVLSGVISGLAGALYAIQLSVVPIETMHYAMSGLAVMMAILGGMNTFFGPFVGAAVFLAIENVGALWTEHWPLLAGAVFVACVLFFREGVWGTLLKRVMPR